LQHCCLEVSLLRTCFFVVLCFWRETCKNFEASVHGISVCFLSFLHLFSINGEGGCVLISKFCKLSHSLYFLGASTDTHTRSNSSCSYMLRTYTYIVIFFLLKLEMQSERVLEACNEKGFWDFFFSLSFCMLGNESKIRGDFVSPSLSLSHTHTHTLVMLAHTHTHTQTYRPPFIMAGLN